MGSDTVCNSCRRLFDGGPRKRWYCSRCNKYHHICPICSKKNRVTCPYCGITLRKKLEPNK